MKSLHHRLLLGLGSVLAAVLLLAALAGYQLSREQLDELFDAEMATSVRILRGLLGHAIESQSPELPPIVLETWLAQRNGGEREGLFESEEEATRYGHKYEKKLAFQIWDSDGHLLAHSSNAPAKALAPLEPGYAGQTQGQHGWRVFTLQDGKHWYQVAERDDVRGELGRQLGIQALLPLLLGLPILAWLIVLVSRRTLRPLKQVADALAEREANRLEALHFPDLPRELLTIVQAMNSLFERLSGAFEREKRFTAEAAHELRTPLAALSIHAQNAQRAESESERQESLDKMLQGLRRTTHVVEQLLALSRVEPVAVSGTWTSVDLSRLCTELVDEFQGQARARQQTLSLNTDKAAALPRVRGNAVLLGLLLRNLLDNALRYTPAGGQIRLALSHNEQTVELQLSDSGPGIPEALRERVFERFFRAADPNVDGSGLGLSIVRQIAQWHGAELKLDSPPEGGLRVTLGFQAVTA